jgi:hypothetical protein
VFPVCSSGKAVAVNGADDERAMAIFNLIGEHWGKLLTAAAIYGSVWTLFAGCDRYFSGEMKGDFARWLRTADLTAFAARFPCGTKAFFEKFFGRKHFSWECVSGSLSVSVLCLSILFLIMGGIPWRQMTLPQIASFVGVILWIIIADYLNLLKSRIVINYFSAKSNSVKRITVVLITDFLLTLPIFVFLGATAIFLGEAIAGFIFYWPEDRSQHILQFWLIFDYGLLKQIPKNFAEYFPQVWGELFPLHKGMFSGLFFVSLVPTLWFWLYAVSSYMTRLVARSEPGIQILRYVWNIEKYPFRVVGLVAGIVASVCYLVGLTVIALT